MKTAQPIWKFVANLGDVNPIEYGGYFVYVDETGVYPPEAELLISPDDEPENPNEKVWEVRRFILEPCTYINGILSYNRFHPDKPAWFAPYILAMSHTFDIPVTDLINLFLSSDPRERAEAWRIVGEYHGWDNLDSYPNTYTRAEVETRYAEETAKV